MSNGIIRARILAIIDRGVERAPLDPGPTEEGRLAYNAIRCHNCQTTIVSEHQHDYKWCKCGYESELGVMVDGGLVYRRYGWGPRSCFTILSEPTPPWGNQ